jgi:hypothetical protein
MISLAGEESEARCSEGIFSLSVTELELSPKLSGSHFWVFWHKDGKENKTSRRQSVEKFQESRYQISCMKGFSLSFDHQNVLGVEALICISK